MREMYALRGELDVTTYFSAWAGAYFADTISRLHTKVGLVGRAAQPEPLI